MSDRVLVVNADDFGRSPGINAGVVAAHERGIVTSASLMVRWPAAVEAAAYARAHPALSIGLHFDLSEWAHRDGAWVPTYEVRPAGDRAAVEDELARQLDAFRALVGDDPTHLDSHQHVHRAEPVHSVLAEAAAELAVPLRGYAPGVRYCGDFYGQTATGDPLPEAITVAALVRIVETLPAGVTELGCHPGADAGGDSTYGAERVREVEALCDASVRGAVVRAGVELVSFAEVARLGQNVA